MNKTRKRHLWWQLPLLLVLIAGTAYVIGQNYYAPYKTCQGTIFGTTYHITYQHSTDLQPQIEAELMRVDSALSMFNSQSVLSLINRNDPKGIPNDMFVEVFRLAQQVSEATDGAFDITVAPLVNLWGFGFKNGQMPSQERVDSILKFVGYKKVRLDNHNRIAKDDPRLMLDCSAIAKGYGVDRVARLLESRSIDNFTVEIGGEVVTRGLSPRHEPWRVGITKPVENDSTEVAGNQTVMTLTNKAMATSGNYRRFYYKNGRRYAHTINPKSGQPVDHSLLSATVMAKNCATADAYATAFMVMGTEKAKAYLASHPELSAYLIYTDKKGKYATWHSPQLSAVFQSSKE